MYIRNKFMQKGRKRYYIIEDRIKRKGKYVTVNVRYLGTAKKLLADLKELGRLKES